jgi:nucleotide-binding universal stress UspA family protein
VLREHVAECDTGDVAVTIAVEFAMFGVVERLTALVDQNPGSIVVMASRGRGRSVALLGSVTEELLQATFGPVLVVGPHVEVTDFSGPVVVSVDGSELSEFAVPLATAWGIELRSKLWVVQVLDPNEPIPSDIAETAYTSRVASKMMSQSGREVQNDVLHGRHAAAAINDYAARIGAALIVAGTHGRTGASRLALGSTAAGLVKKATCPVLLVRPPHFPRPKARGETRGERRHSVT